MTCDGVMSELSRADVVVFQKWIVLSDVPPPEARRDEFHGHQARAFGRARVSMAPSRDPTACTHFDCGSVVRLGHLRRVSHAAIPDVDDIVIASAGEELWAGSLVSRNVDYLAAPVLTP